MKAQHKQARWLLSFLFAIILAGCFATNVQATTATINVSGSEGAIPLSASATFTKDDGSSTSGSLAVYHNNYYMGGGSGSGSASWSTTLDGGAMAQGAHTFKAVGCANGGDCNSSSATINIDNTPELDATLTQLESGEIKFKGSVTFKEHVRGNEGSIYLYHDHNLYGYNHVVASRTYDSIGPHQWSWEEFVGSIIDSGKLAQGEHKFKVVARAANGATKEKELQISIDNTPELDASLTQLESGEIQFKGSVSFKPVVTATEGSLYLYHDHNLYGYNHVVASKTYEGIGPHQWSWEGLVGSIIDAGKLAQGEHKFKVVVKSTNGEKKEKELSISIDNTPELDASLTQLESGEIQFKGSVSFKPVVTATEGSLYLYHDHNLYGYNHVVASKTYEGIGPHQWSWEGLVGSIIDAGKLAQGEHKFKVVVKSTNGEKKEKELSISIDNTPELTAIQKIPVGTDQQYFDLQTSVTFKEHVGGYEGRVYVYLNGHLQGSKAYDVKQKTVKYSEITGGVFKEIDWIMSEAVVTFKAVAYNGAWAQQDWSPAGLDDNLGNPDEEPDDEKPNDSTPEPDPPPCK